ncbi:hypothetical protein C0Q60_03165 [Streptomyces albidoflavus]|nr:hypothetical protein C0Q60_03165 [Streptomyces albidoflavus]RZE04885.1 hypothetical protein C0Q62_03080 [Streptomyces albidoflavus]
MNQTTGQSTGLFTLCEVGMPLGSQSSQFRLGLGGFAVTSVLFDKCVEGLASIGDRALQPGDLLSRVADLIAELCDVCFHVAQPLPEAGQFCLVTPLPLLHVCDAFVDSLKCRSRAELVVHDVLPLLAICLLIVDAAWIVFVQVA